MATMGLVALVGLGGVLFGGIFVAIGLIRMRMVRGWVSTTGMIVDKGGLLGGVPAQYPTYRWRDATGREHQHTSSVSSSLGPRPGTLVEVRYDPQAPDRGMLTGLVQSGWVFVIVGGVIIAAAVIAAIVLAVLL